MKRRHFLGLIASASAAVPFQSRAQQADRLRHVGIVMTLGADDPQGQSRLNALRDGLREFGWIEGRTIKIDYRAERDASRIAGTVEEMLSLHPEVIVAAAPPAVVALKKATKTVPIVFAQVPEPVHLGLVDSLARPSGNITGFSLFDFPIAGKWLDLLKQLAPRVERAVALAYHASPTQAGYLAAMKPAADLLGIRTVEASVRDAADIEDAIRKAAGSTTGLIVLPNPLTSGQRNLITGLARQYRLPAIYAYRYFAASGGLASYGVDNVDTFKRAASYVDRILKGEKPADLPVQASVKYEFVINLKTAKELGLTIPLPLLARADEVIE